jgi:hypothetical protein
MDVLADHFAPQINLTRSLFICYVPSPKSTYYDEMFHLYSVYHLAFPQERLIALDADLHFQDGVDIVDLDDQFDLVSPEQLIGIAPDLSLIIGTIFCLIARNIQAPMSANDCLAYRCNVFLNEIIK